MPTVHSAVVLLLAMPAAVAQTACLPGWTQAPSSSSWGDKCYKEFGPSADARDGMPTTGGHNHSECRQVCRSQSTTGRLLCATSSSEIAYVAGSAYMEGWTGYTQDTTASDYAEPAGGWRWEGCVSTYQPTWYQYSSGSRQTPDDTGNGMTSDVSCTILFADQTINDYACGDGTGSAWSRCAPPAHAPA